MFFFNLRRHIPSWSPFGEFKRDAVIVKKAVDEMMDIPFSQVDYELVGILMVRYLPCLD
jgi:hypothetical protein